ncbi:MAG: hypothetical protein IK084_00195 [Bacteroidaceae bacterium]|nr:hypothetical protein [Bacteroidaceae bacterium]
MKKTILYILCSLFTVLAWGGTKDTNTRKVLDATASHLNKAGGISLNFTATTLQGKTPQGTASGTMDIQGKKFTITMPEMQSWFDGKTQWTMLTDDDEVSISEPTGAELQAINPYAFIDIYKQGFNYKMKKGTLSNGKNGYKIFLNADNKKQEIREIYLEVDNQYNPVRVSMRQGKSQWVRIIVNSFRTGQKFDSDHFTFPKAKYPNAIIIDLR